MKLLHFAKKFPPPHMTRLQETDKASKLERAFLRFPKAGKIEALLTLQ